MSSTWAKVKKRVLRQPRKPTYDISQFHGARYPLGQCPDCWPQGYHLGVSFEEAAAGFASVAAALSIGPDGERWFEPLGDLGSCWRCEASSAATDLGLCGPCQDDLKRGC